jgi:cytochrome c556
MTLLRAAIALFVAAGCKGNSAEPVTCPAVECPPSGSAAAAAASDAAGPPPNVVQTEMRMLTQILEATVRGIGANDVRGIDEQLHRLHAAKEATSAAVKSGTYKLPKNPEGVAQFEAMDEAFHEHLGSLVRASRANDVPAAADALAQIVRGCPSCHAVFRP